MAAKKFKGEPIAEAQIKTGGLSEKQVIDEATRLHNGYTESYKTYKGVTKQMVVQKDFSGQLYDLRNAQDDASKYRASILEKLRGGVSQESKDPSQDRTGARAIEKKKKIGSSSVTGNQGIIGSMLNLGGNKLLGN